MTLMNEFNIAVKDSVSYQDGLVNIGNYKYYYSSLYGEKIKEYLKRLGADSKEDSKESLRSTSSSARLCTNYFFSIPGVKFEVPIYNDVSSTPTKMDAVLGKTFYECKCQEIVDGEHELLRKSYYTKKSSKLFKEFNISNIKIKPHFNKKGEEDYWYCDFDLRDLDINLDGKYYEINFNVKQLICHLIAIANQYDDKEEKTLQYVVFKPKKEIVEQSETLTKLYEEIDKQFIAIQRSDKIQNFISQKKHNIKLPNIKYIFIDEIEEHFKY